MNIVEAFLHIFGKFFIHIIGLPGSNYTKYARELAKDLNIKFIDVNDYLSNVIPKIVLPNSTQIDNIYHTGRIDIESLIDDINSNL